MLAFLSRFAGLWLIAAGLIAVVVDATRSIAAGRIIVTPLGQSWYSLSPGTLIGAQTFVEQQVESYIGQWLWDPLIQWLLLLPGWAVLGAAGLVLAWLGRRRAERRSYV